MERLGLKERHGEGGKPAYVTAQHFAPRALTIDEVIPRGIGTAICVKRESRAPLFNSTPLIGSLEA